MIKSANRTFTGLAMDSFIFALKQADWSTGDKYVAASNPEFAGKEPHEIFTSVVEIKPGVFVYLTTASVKGDRAEGRYTLEAPTVEATKKKKAPTKKKSKKDVIEDMVEDALEDILEAIEEL